jgi:integrase
LRHGKTVALAAEDALPASAADSVPTVYFNNAYDRQLSVIEAFLIWALDRENRGGGPDLQLEQMTALQVQLHRVFESLRGGFVPSKRIEPLSASEVAQIRQLIAPLPGLPQPWDFPIGGFTRSAQLRNWLMFETALGLGLRRGELLKLRVDSLVKGGQDGIRVLRCPDDPQDSRMREPAVKSAERLLPLSPLLLEAMTAYLSLRPPLGRATGKTSYLFTTRTGAPVSLDAADSIAAAISRRSGIVFSWHSLRHTWAETLADQLLQREDGIELLMYLGGWTNPKSPEHYIEHARQRQAGEWLKRYQQTEGGSGHGSE